MKRALAVLLVVLALCGPMAAQSAKATPPVAFRALQMQYTAISWCDFAMTSWALKSGLYAEGNPLAKFYVNKPGLAIPILALSDLAVHWGLDSIYKDNKTVAWVMLIVFNVARGYVLYHNLKLSR